MIDFDGVLLRNRRVQRYVGHRCTEYLAQRTGRSYADARRTNASRYPVHGHTALVLERDFGVPCGPKEFNQGVYGSIDYDRVRSWLTKQDTLYTQYILDKLRVDDDAFVFTNAPRQWVQEMRGVLGIPFPDERILGSDTLGHFKPDPRAYAEAEFFVRLVAPRTASFCLVDDSAENVKTAMVLPRWRGLLFD
jgi:FMN phosphatase YigB (HAD superfamily)